METIAGLRRRLDRGEVSPRELTEDALARIDERDGETNAFLTVRADEALAEADALATARERGPLWGVPIAIKDIIDVAGTRTTAASAILRDNVAHADAHVVERLRAAEWRRLGVSVDRRPHVRARPRDPSPRTSPGQHGTLRSGPNAQSTTDGTACS